MFTLAASRPLPKPAVSGDLDWMKRPNRGPRRRRAVLDVSVGSICWGLPRDRPTSCLAQGLTPWCPFLPVGLTSRTLDDVLPNTKSAAQIRRADHTAYPIALRDSRIRSVVVLAHHSVTPSPCDEPPVHRHGDDEDYRQREDQSSPQRPRSRPDSVAAAITMIDNRSSATPWGYGSTPLPQQSRAGKDLVRGKSHVDTAPKATICPSVCD